MASFSIDEAKPMGMIEGIHCCKAMENNDLETQEDKLRNFDRAERWRDTRSAKGFPSMPADICAYDDEVSAVIKRYAHCHDVFLL